MTSSTRSLALALVMAAAVASLPHTAAQFGDWEDCQSTRMIITNGYKYDNLEIMTYKRLSSNETVLDCLEMCKQDQDCLSFNYEKVKKWCYLSISHWDTLASKRNSKFSTGYRKCTEHADDNSWDNTEFAGGIEGTEPSPPENVAVVGNPASDTVTVTWAQPAFPGTIDGINYATISGYTVACSGALSFKTSVGAQMSSYTHTAVYTSNGSVKCTVTAKKHC